MVAGRLGKSFDPRAIVRGDDQLIWQVVDQPLSHFANRSVPSRWPWTSPGTNKSNKILGVTSSLPNEGKSTIAAALAQMMSHSGRRVILVDCDLRVPTLTRRLAPRAAAGLLEVTSGKASLNEVLWIDRSTNLSFLPAVAKARLLHTTDILAADETKRLFERLRETYDYIIVDLSPLVPIVDVRAIKGLVDSYVFVIEWGRTKIDLVERALKEATGIYSNVLGVVLNKADTSALNRYEGYGSYHYKKYYHRYGYTQ